MVQYRVGFAASELGGGLASAVRFAEDFRDAGGGRIRTVLGPHSPYVCPPSFLAEVAALAKEKGLGLHVHTSESEEQVANSLKAHGLRPVEHLARAGVLDVPVTLAHALYVDAHELALMAQPHVSVAHCPSTYAKLAMGVPSLARFTAAGVRVALGTDGPASNNDLSMLRALRMTALLQKLVTADPEAAPSLQVLDWACRHGAQACGFGDSGVLAPGRAADLVIIDTRRPHLRPRHDLAAAVVHTAGPGDVRDVLCDGRWLLRKGELTTLDEERILREAEDRALAMVRKNLHTVREYRG